MRRSVGNQRVLTEVKVERTQRDWPHDAGAHLFENLCLCYRCRHPFYGRRGRTQCYQCRNELLFGRPFVQLNITAINYTPEE